MKAPDNTYHSGRYTKVQYAGKTGLPTSTKIPEWRHLTTLTILGDTPRCNMPAKQACQPVLKFQNEGTWQHLPFWEIHQSARCRQELIKTLETLPHAGSLAKYSHTSLNENKRHILAKMNKKKVYTQTSVKLWRNSTTCWLTHKILTQKSIRRPQ